MPTCAFIFHHCLLGFPPVPVESIN